MEASPLCPKELIEMKEKKVDLEADELYLASEGLIYRVVCAPKSWDAQRVQDETNAKFGRPGISNNEWVITEGDTLNEKWMETEDGNPGKCTEEHRCHWLLNC